MGVSVILISLILIDPRPNCFSADNTPLDQCTISMVCDFIKNPQNFAEGENLYFDFEFKNSWTEEYKLYCDRKRILSSSKTTIFLINTGLIFFFNIISDYFGRRKTIIAACIFTLSQITSLFDIHLYLKVISFGIAYGAINSIEGLIPPVLEEAVSLESKMPEVVLTIGYLANGITVILMNFLLLYVEIQTNFMLLGLIIFTVFILFPLVWIMTESPIYLYRKG